MISDQDKKQLCIYWQTRYLAGYGFTQYCREIAGGKTFGSISSKDNARINILAAYSHWDAQRSWPAKRRYSSLSNDEIRALVNNFMTSLKNNEPKKIPPRQ